MRLPIYEYDADVDGHRKKARKKGSEHVPQNNAMCKKKAPLFTDSAILSWYCPLVVVQYFYALNRE